MFPMNDNLQFATEPVVSAAAPWHILVVDDDPEVHEVTRLVLGSFRFAERPLNLISVESANQAFDALRRRDDIAVVLLDMTMPVMGGEQTFHELRKIRPNLLAIASSGYSEAEALARFGQGIAGFVQKPYTSVKLAAKIAEVMATKKKTLGAG